YIDVFNDITALESAKQKIEIMAITDSLTGLYNGNFFDDTMCCLDREGRRPVALIIGDVDGLKKVNDTYGHAQGDEIIRKAAAAMKAAVRSGDVVARIGGDEFAILLENISQVDVERIIEKIRMNYRELSSKDIPLSICLGYAISNNVTHSMDEVLRLADEDMYNYKREIYNKG
ncbi:MAG: GGDEF domain-containing protein, partial [Syntrophomonadaceae bacterium]|nr:GGDEF domain-containing protein [Syntrophomonadaceae bacterium]